MFRGRQPGVYNSWRIFQAQVNGFSNNIYIGYQTLEEAVEEFNQFPVDEAMAYQGMAVQALPTQGMALQAMPI
jgi:viroplasmin and RNaseH domain-containing protein